jgi:hypothetical protein
VDACELLSLPVSKGPAEEGLTPSPVVCPVGVCHPLSPAGPYFEPPGVTYIERRWTLDGYDLPDSPWKNRCPVKEYGRERDVELYGSTS